jgi:hypothetical protein
MSEQGDRNSNEDENERQGKAEIHSEEVKDRHTSHWDMDYMTREEMDAVYRQQQEDPPQSDSDDAASDD